MKTVEEIMRAVRDLSAKDVREFRRWFLQLDAELWDERFEDDVAAGRLDHLAEET